MKNKYGFHLIEILLVLSLISILSTLAIPLYSHYLIQLKRLNAAHRLLKLSLALEEYHANYQTYENATLTALHIPSWIDSYQLAIINATIDNYEISAQPSPQQARKDSQCGTLILLASGEKKITGPGEIDACW